jgi:hypothetical protein
MGRLTGKFADHIEILIDVQHGEPGELRGGRNEQIRDRRRAVQLHLERAILNCRREVFDRHRAERGFAKIAAGASAAAG